MSRRNKGRSWLGSFSFSNNEWEDSYTPRRSSFWTFNEKRQEMVSPYMVSFDAFRLYGDVKKAVEAEIGKKIHGSGDRFISAEGGDRFTAGSTAVRVIADCVPSHLVQDIYNLYFHKASEHEYSIVDDTNRAKFNLLQSVNDSSIKIMTNGSVIASSIFATEICKGIARALLDSLTAPDAKALGYCMSTAKAEKREQNDDEDGEGNGSGESGDDSDSEGEGSGDSERGSQSQSSSGKDDGGNGDCNGKDGNQQGDSTPSAKEGRSKSEGAGDSKPMGETTQKSSASKSTSSAPGSLDGQYVKTGFEALMDKVKHRLQAEIDAAKMSAFSKISDLEKYGVNLAEIESRGGNIANLVRNIDRVRKEAQGLTFNDKKLRSVIDRILDKSFSYFSSKCTSHEVSIFESDTFDEFDGLEFLHPVLRNVKLDEVVTRENRYHGKLNIYVDVSGSMDGHVRIGDATVPAILFAKALCIRLYEMGIANVIIPFGNDLKTPIDPPNMLDILLLTAHCGTSINKVVIDCERRGENAIVVTDCEDQISYNSSHCFILGTPGACFSLDGPGYELRDNSQLWIFNDKGDDIIQYE